ncbi:glycoside hydrolase, partial [Tothia fuscella]
FIMKSFISLSALFGLSAAHGIIKTITIDGTVYPGFDPRFDIQWNQKRIEWGFSSKSSAQGVGPVSNVTSPDMTCRFSPIVPPALTAVARAGSDVIYKWTDYPGNHKGPIITYMGRLATPTQNPAEVEFFKIHETTYDKQTGLWANDVLRKNNMTWKVAIPSDLKEGNYIIRHEVVALHYAGLDNRSEFYISCLNVKLLGDGTAEPRGVRFPGAYKATDPGLKIDIYDRENRYVRYRPTRLHSLSNMLLYRSPQDQRFTMDSIILPRVLLQ